MKKRLTLYFLLCLGAYAYALTPKEIIHASETKYSGELSSYSELEMTIVRPHYTRQLGIKDWYKKEGGVKQSLALITAPAKERGQTFLKDGTKLWSWNPSIQRLIKLPPSMMSQGWMGSDVSNDDIMKESSFENDYTQTLLKTEDLGGYRCYVLELIPHEEGNITWGKIVMWISVDDFFQMKLMFYDEDGELVKTHLSSEIKTFDDRTLPSVIEIQPADEEDQKTIITLKAMLFNQKIAPEFFSIQNMKHVE